jgi:hypothetical protein
MLKGRHPFCMGRSQGSRIQRPVSGWSGNNAVLINSSTPGNCLYQLHRDSRESTSRSSRLAVWVLTNFVKSESQRLKVQNLTKALDWGTSSWWWIHPWKLRAEQQSNIFWGVLILNKEGWPLDLFWIHCTCTIQGNCALKTFNVQTGSGIEMCSVRYNCTCALNSMYSLNNSLSECSTND